MAPPELDAEIDRLYQLPLAEFTAARNHLAGRAGSAGADIRALRKPTLVAWAVNQLHWRAPALYDAVVAASQRVRQAQRAVLSGNASDARGADRALRDAVRAALDPALALIEAEGHPVTGATRDAVRRTLEGLPADVPPGRLTEALSPPGFEALAGVVSIGARRAARDPRGTAGRKARAGYAERELFDATRALRGLEHRLAELRAAETAARIRAERLQAHADETRRMLDALQQEIERAGRELDTRHRAVEGLERERDAAEARVAALRRGPAAGSSRS